MEIKIAIIGGKLRGIEIAFLARMAGIHTTLIDKEKLMPASGLCSESYVFDVEKKEPALLAILKNVDVVVPAVERKSVLEAIEDIRRDLDLKVAFDFTAYDVTASKIRSDLLIQEASFPHLAYYPNAEPPYVLKPAVGNRRRYIRKVDTREELDFLISRKDSPESWIAQEYVKGPNYSITVVGKPGDYTTYEVAQLYLENDFDSNMVGCPVELDQKLKDKLNENAISLAEKLQLTGIMELEAVHGEDELRIMEINAVFPTQTPITVFYSTGINILVDLLKIFVDDNTQEKLSKIINKSYDKPKHVVLKDFQFLNHTPTFRGESNLEKAGPLKMMVDFFDADYGITDYIDDDHEWQSIFINIAENEDKLIEKRIKAREALLEHCRKQL